MDIKKLRDPLPIESIDFRVQSVNKGGYATILAYKDARADMNRLDAVVGPFNWKRQHVRDNANCIISIWDPEKKEWISKEDTGTESNTEKEKGLASDSFKRAGFNWGIGRELYDYPVIQIKLNKNEFTLKNDKAYVTWDFKLKQWNWESKFERHELIYLKAVDPAGSVRFEYKKGESAQKQGTFTGEPDPKPNGKVKPTEKAWKQALEKLKVGEVDKDQLKSALTLTPEQIKEVDAL